MLIGLLKIGSMNGTSAARKYLHLNILRLQIHVDRTVLRSLRFLTDARCGGLVTHQFFEVGNECCSRIMKSNNSQTQTDNSSLQALWLNSSVEISS